MQTRRLGLSEVLVTIVLCLILATLLAPAMTRTRCGGGNRTKCSNNLRQIALAAIQYSDDKRFLPHVGKIKQLDGDADTSDAPRTIRSLVWYGYHDNPEGFVCPSSSDLFVPIQDTNVRDNMRLWMWKGKTGQAKASPWTAGNDPTLRNVEELSYTYTRRGYGRSLSSTKVLAADRAIKVKGSETSKWAGDVGNHEDGWHVAKADATVEIYTLRQFDRPTEAVLRGTGREDAALPMGGGL
jgi:type II secretory pathway pseudopilin PulG